MEETGARAGEVLERFDISSRYRSIPGLGGKAISLIAIFWSSFQLYTAVFGSLEPMIQRSIHLGFALVLTFFLYPGEKALNRNKIDLLDIVFAILGAYGTLYVVFNFRELAIRAGYMTTIDLITGILLIVVMFEACRRVVGIPLTVVAGVCLAYAYFGNYIPGYFGNRGYSIARVVAHMYLTTEGIFGVPLGVSASYIFLFILFGSFLFRTGLGQLFIDLAIALTGHQAGGPAKVAVVSSALMGTINGSTVANVVGTGSFTIPLMKSIGYKPYFAAAVEAAASTGGQLMPPIMGAAAFVMSEFTGIPYLRIALAASIPAILYYFSVILQVHLEAKKMGLTGMPKDRLPNAKVILKERGHLLIPVFVILGFLIKGYTPTYAAFYGIVSTIIVSFFSAKTRLTARGFWGALEGGARDAISIAVACGIIGFIIGTATLTGLGMKIASGIVQLAHDNLMLTLFFTMIACLILGTGLPTTANYIVVSTMAAPALIMMKVPLLAAHMFVFYYGIIADLTPPVALGAMAAAGLAGADPFRTGVQATKLAVVSYLIPYFFVIFPMLLWIDVEPLMLIWAFVSAVLGVTLLAVGIEGYFLSPLKKWERLLSALAGIGLLDPGLVTDLLGLCVFTLIIGRQVLMKRRKHFGGKKEPSEFSRPT